MRIAYICADPGVPVFGRKGCSIHVQEVVRGMRKRAARVELFAARLGGDPPPGLESVPIHRLPRPSGPELARREQSCLEANRNLRTRLDRLGSFDLVYERYSLWSFAGMEYAQSARVPGLLEVNAPLIEEQVRHRGLVDVACAARVAQKAFEMAAALIAVSEELVVHLEGQPAARGRVHLVPNGVDPSRFPEDVETERARRSGGFTVGFLGSLKPWHGLPLLVEAFSRVHEHDPGVRLLIVGDGPERRSLLEDLAGRQLHEAASLTGPVRPTAVPALLAGMDVGVAPYAAQPHFYFSPLKVYEYMAAGLPVVASRIGQVASLIQDGENGLLCPAGDAGAFGEAIDRLRQTPELRSRLGGSARQTVIRKHSWDAVVERLFMLAGLEAGAKLDAVRARS